MTRSLYRIPSLGLAVTVILLLSGRVSAAEPIQLRERFPVNYQYRVSCRVELSGNLTLPLEKGQTTAKTLPITGTSAIDYDERVLAVGADGSVQKTLRQCRRIDFQRRVGDQPQEGTIRPGVRRLVILRHKNSEVPFSPDGPLTWGEIELVRVDVFTPALAGLLPEQAVRPGDRWTAANSAIEELTDMERIEDGRIECKLEEVTTLANRRHARVSLSGTVRGVNEDGPSKQQLDGYFYFDLESHHLSYLTFRGAHGLLDKDGKEAGRVVGSFTLTRQAHVRTSDLTDDALKGVKLEPDADNTLLLYDNPDLGVRLLYPRRWRVGTVRGKQLTLDEPGGNGLLLTLEPLAKLPAAAQFQAEARGFFEQQKAKVLRVEAPQRLQAAPQDVERFSMDIEMAGQPATMDYYLLRQAKGGATVAARLLPKELATVRGEVEKVVRGVVITAEVK
jgi:hypothetical protein